VTSVYMYHTVRRHMPDDMTVLFTLHFQKMYAIALAGLYTQFGYPMPRKCV